ncbi:MAG: c-type cytochrome domain-containing protein [Roseimicrobium sp.]
MNRAPLLAIVLGCFLLGIACQRRDSASADPISFSAHIKPILESRCINCHHSGALFGALNLESRSHAFKPRSEGPAIVPGQPTQSRLYVVLTLPEADRKAMPPTGHRIPAEEVARIKQWIAEGAAWPEGPEGTLKVLVNASPTGV